MVPSIDDSFFTQVRFRGAFDGSNDWTAGWSEFNPGAKVYGAATDTLGNGNTVSGTPFEITTNVALDKNKVYLLRGWVYVANGGVLGRPKGTQENQKDFLNKGKNKKIAELLNKGWSYRQISKQLDTSTATIQKVKTIM